MSSAAEVVKRMLDAAVALDAAGVLACLDDNVQCVEPVSLPYGGVHRGVAAFRDNVFGAITSRFNLQIGRCEIIGTEGKVAASMDLSYTSRRTGRKLMIPYVEVYTVHDQKIVHIDVYPQDTKLFVEFWEANC